MRTVTIIGGGSWGTALALALTRSHRPHAVRLWAVEKDLVERMRASRENDLFLPGFRLPRGIHVTNDLGEASHEADVILSVVPTQFLRSVWQGLATQVSSRTAISVSIAAFPADPILRKASSFSSNEPPPPDSVSA